MLQLIADENILFANEVFSSFGKLKLLPGREITRDNIKNADVLIVRSVTEVNEQLLTGTNIKFVGTATTGNDHINIDYLNSEKIIFADAEGCNSNSVVEYVFASLFSVLNKNKISIKDKSIGIIGVGNIGSKIASVAKAIGMKVLKNDPPLQKISTTENFVALTEALQADIVSFHVPLTSKGEHKTFHLLNEKNISFLKNDAILINTARGSVVDNKSLLKFLKKKNINLILDVWEGEPNLNLALLEKVLVATAHIAGYSLEGRINGTKMIFDALNNFTGTNVKWGVQIQNVKNNLRAVQYKGLIENKINNLISSVYDVRKDSDSLKSLTQNKLIDLSKGFDKLRKEYPIRREFRNYVVELKSENANLKNSLEALRFKVEIS